jgi:excinuclease UvrABC nuclease subunit
VTIEVEPSPNVAYGWSEDDRDCFMFHGDVLAKMLGPLVYIIRTPDADGMLYIGSAKNGLARISDEAHVSLRQALAVPHSRLIVRICKSEMHARDLESQMIVYYQPKLNKIGKSLHSSMAKAILAEALIENG